MAMELPMVLASGSISLAVDLMLILGASALVATLFQRARLESIPGFLIAGVLLGPGVLNVVRDVGNVEQISQLAVILLMFGIGLHLDINAVRRGMVHILAIGAISTLAFALVAWGALVLAGVSVPVALLLALAGSLSSTAVFVRVLTARREVSSSHGRVGLGIAITQDMAAVVILAVIPPIARWAGATPAPGPAAALYAGLPEWLDWLARAGVALGAVSLLVVVGRYVLPRVLHEVARVGSGELTLVFSGAVALGAAILTQQIGLSPEMGAFLAGFLLAATPFRYHLSGQLAPMRDLLMAVFFTAVGLKLDPSMLVSAWWQVLLAAGVVIALKGTIIAGTSWAMRMTGRSGLLTGAYLANAGEFALIVLGEGVRRGAIGEVVSAQAVGVVMVTLVVSPLLIAPAQAWAERMPTFGWLRRTCTVEGLEEGGDAEPGAPAETKHVVIAGFGPVGRTLADRFAALKVPFVVIDLNPTTVEKQAKLGRRVVYGDVTNAEVLESARVHEAEAVLLTIPDAETMLRACRLVRAMAPGVFIAVRASYLSGSFAAQQLGADHVTVEEIACAQAMEREVLAKLDRRRERRAGEAGAGHEEAATGVRP